MGQRSSEGICRQEWGQLCPPLCPLHYLPSGITASAVEMKCFLVNKAPDFNTVSLVRNRCVSAEDIVEGKKVMDFYLHVY